MERSGSVGRALEHGDLKVASSRLAVGGVTVLGHCARHFIRCVMVQPRKTRPDMTENC